jgi:hypothetical protein
LINWVKSLLPIPFLNKILIDTKLIRDKIYKAIDEREMTIPKDEKIPNMKCPFLKMTQKVTPR